MSSPFYPPGKGYCLIIGSSFTGNNSDVKPLSGESIMNDCQLIKRTFESFNCQENIKTFHNLSFESTKTLFNNVAKNTKWSEYQFLVVYITSHGNEKEFYCADGIPYPKINMLEQFNAMNVDKLKCKPKIFILDVYQEEEVPPKVTEKEDISYPKVIPSWQDFLFVYGTYSKKTDPRLTLELCTVLNGDKWESLHLTSLLTLVINRWSQLLNQSATERQIPYFYSTLISFFKLSKIGQSSQVLNTATKAIAEYTGAPNDSTGVPLNGGAFAGNAFQLIAKENLDFQNMLKFVTIVQNRCFNYCEEAINDETVWEIFYQAEINENTYLSKVIREYINKHWASRSLRVNLNEYMEKLRNEIASKTCRFKSNFLGELYRIAEEINEKMKIKTN